MYINNVKRIYTYRTERTSWDNPVTRPVYILSYQVSGNYLHTFKDKEVTVSAGCIFLINKNDTYRVKCYEKGYSICVTFESECDIETNVWDMSSDHEVYNLFMKLSKFKNLKDHSNLYMAMSIIYALFSKIERYRDSVWSGSELMKRVEKSTCYIAEHISDGKITSFELADLCGIGDRYYRTLFKKRFGISPGQYVNNVRMNEAAVLLAEGQFSVGEVADMVGVSDLFYFSKLFKKHFGVSPSEYAHGAYNIEQLEKERID